MYITRVAESYLENVLLKGRKVGIVLGARQVGKTTLVEHVLSGKKAIFLNFDVEVDQMRFQAAASLAPKDSVRSLGNPNFVVVDEAQRMPETARIVKGWYDSRIAAKILLLGSSSLNLLDQAAESLTGRNEKLILPPLLFEEALRSQEWYDEAYTRVITRETLAKPLRIFLLSRMAFGSYPEAVTTTEKTAFLRNLSSDYLWKDILHAGLVKTPATIKRLLQLLAHQAGSEVSIHELATQLQIARPTVERYLDLLEQTYVIFQLPAFSTNPRKEIVKSRKIYFWDTGIRNALLNAFSTEEFRPDIGRLWESWVIAEVAKRNLLEGSKSELFFWRSRAQSEVDLIVKTAENLKAFEIKWQQHGRGTHRAFASMYGVEVRLLESSNPFVARTVFGDS